MLGIVPGLLISIWYILLSHWKLVIGGFPGIIIVKGNDILSYYNIQNLDL